MNPVEEKSLSRELLSSKSRIYRFSVVIREGYRWILCINSRAAGMLLTGRFI
jgi:hypothetical protein